MGATPSPIYLGEKMLVKMKFSLPIEDVEKEVNERFYKTYSGLTLTAVKVQELKKFGIIEQVEQLQKIREEILVLDSTLQDCYDVLTSLIALKAERLVPPETEKKGRENDSRKTQ
jgi:hypothetical protein